MKNSIIPIIGFLVCLTAGSSAQSTVKVEVSKDTVMMGDLVELTYTIENGQGKLVPPNLKELPIVSGPNTSSSMLYENGKMSSTQSYSYILRPDQEGTLIIPETMYIEAGDTIRLAPIPIEVNKHFPVAPPKGKEIRSSSGTVRERKKF